MSRNGFTSRHMARAYVDHVTASAGLRRKRRQRPVSLSPAVVLLAVVAFLVAMAFIRSYA